MYIVNRNTGEPSENSLVLMEAKGEFMRYNKDAEDYSVFDIDIDTARQYKYMIVYCDMFWIHPTSIVFTNNLNNALMCIGGVWGKNRFAGAGELFRRDGSLDILYYKNNVFKNKNIVIESFAVSKREYFF